MDSPLPVVLKALAYAARKHRDQRRVDIEASPYINHPIALANVLANEGGIIDPVVICAALLHDTVEDTDATREEVEALFGEEVASIVVEVTDDMSLTKAERMRLQVEHAPHMSPKAKLVKLADKICNLRDVAAGPPTGWSLEKRQNYFNQGKQVVDNFRGISPALEQAFDEVFARRPTE